MMFFSNSIRPDKLNQYFLWCVIATLLSGCSMYRELPAAQLKPIILDAQGEYNYKIGTGDLITISVWRNPDASGDYLVAPDGKISLPLTDPVLASGMTIEQLKNKITELLRAYIKSPQVTITLRQSVGIASEQIRLIGEAVTPQSVSYRKGMTMLDLMIASGGLTLYADGNSALLFRIVDNKTVTYRLRLDDLMKNGDLSANIDLSPGDIVQIPESWF